MVKKTIKKYKTNTGLKNISKHKASGKYEVRVNVKDNSKSTSFYVGLSNTLADAIVMRNEFIKDLF